MSIIQKTAPTGVPLRVVMSHPVPMWKTKYFTQRTDELRHMIERMVDPSETLFLADERVVTLTGEDYVLVLSPGGVGWMWVEHLGELDCF